MVSREEIIISILTDLEKGQMFIENYIVFDSSGVALVSNADFLPMFKSSGFILYLLIQSLGLRPKRLGF